MKFEDLDGYIDNLFSQARVENPDLSGFDTRLANVEGAILDAYESAMRWHSAQIAGGEAQLPEPVSPSQLDESELMTIAYTGVDTYKAGYTYEAAVRAMREAAERMYNEQMGRVKPVKALEVMFYILVAVVVLGVGLPLCQVVTRVVFGARW